MSKNKAAMALGKLGGKVKSDRKAEASKANGLKGGRPKKIKPEQEPEPPEPLQEPHEYL